MELPVSNGMASCIGRTDTDREGAGQSVIYSHPLPELDKAATLLCNRGNVWLFALL
jgi:hypothetical protein